MASVLPASAEQAYYTNQQTLFSFLGSSNSLSSMQKQQIRGSLEKNPWVEKFICTGVRSAKANRSEAIQARLRAKAACDFAKTLRPEISVWYQTKPSAASTFAGKVLLSLKTPAPQEVGLANQLPISECQIPAVYSGWNSAGFPIELRFEGRETYTPLVNSGTIRALVIPVDFSNYPASGSPSAYLKPVLDKTNRFYKSMSYGKVEFDFTVLPEYVRISRTAESFGLGTWGVGDYGKYFQAALDVAAAKFDVSGFDVAIVIASPKTPQSAFAPGPAFPEPFQTIDGEVPLGTATGLMDTSENGFRWLAHELGHLFGWVDLYTSAGHIKFGWWDIMSMNWETHDLEINGWFRLQRGWISEDDAVCLSLDDLSTLRVNLAPLHSGEGTKLILVKLDNHKVLVVEDRRRTTFAPMSGPKDEGLLVYTVNTAIQQSAGQVEILLKPNFKADTFPSWSTPHRDAALGLGDSVSVSRIKIQPVMRFSGMTVVDIKKR